MILRPGDAKQWKYLDQVLRIDIPAVKKNAKVMEALTTWSGYSSARVEKALTYGNDPIVKVRELDSSNVLSERERVWGNTPNNSDHTRIIEIDEALIHLLESYFVEQAKEPAASNLKQLRRFVRDTLLHELVHFGNNDTSKEWEGVEAGAEFEEDAGLPRLFPIAFFRALAALEAMGHPIGRRTAWVAAP